MKPVWKWTIGIISALIVTLIGTGWYLTTHWKPVLESKLQELIQKSTDSLYSVKYDALDLNLALGNVTLTNLRLRSDSNVYQELVLKNKAPNNRFDIDIDILKIRRLNILDIILDKRLDINKIVVQSPTIQVINEYHDYNDTIPKKPKDLYDQIKNTLKAIDIKSTTLSNVDLRFKKVQNGKLLDFHIKDVMIQADDFLIDENSLSDTSRFLYSKSIYMELPKFQCELPDGFYKAQFDKLTINTKNKDALLTKVSLKPKMKKASFFKSKNMNVAMTVLDVDSIWIRGLNFKTLIKHHQIIADSILLKNGNLSIHMNKRYPQKPGSRIGEAPHQRLMKLNSILNFEKVLVDNLDVSYTERSAKTNQEGVITFENARGTLSNVTNDSIQLTQNRMMTADLHARIMGSGNIRVQFGFDMLSKNGLHTYSGTLGNMQATAFNKILLPLLNVEISSGNIKQIKFNMTGTDYRNWGKFDFTYDDLKIKLLSKNDDGVRSKKAILSFVVNQVLINDSNPDSKDVYHHATITNYQRKPEHSFFKTMWQSLLEGIKQSAGISPEREAKLMGTATKAQKTVEDTKEAVKKTGTVIKKLFNKNKQD